MERHQPDRRMPPHVAQGRRPARVATARSATSLSSSSGQDRLGLHLGPPPVPAPEDRTARPAARARRRPACAAGRRGLPARAADCAPCTWKPMAMSIGVSRGQPFGIDAQRIVLGIAAEGAVGEHVEARHASPSERMKDLVRSPARVRPQPAGAGIEQHRDDGEIDAPPRDLLLRADPSSARPAPPSDRGRRPRNAASANGTGSSPDRGSAGASP